MIPETHETQPWLRQFFYDTVSDTYVRRLGLEDTEIAGYVAGVLTRFTDAENLYCVRDPEGRPVREVAEMLLASDPVHGTASSFGEEREVRRHIGDYALFLTGMYPKPDHAHWHREPESFSELVRAGKESYYIVSQFNMFEYASEAPLFARLSEQFERCLYGLTLVREQLGIGSGTGRRN